MEEAKKKEYTVGRLREKLQGLPDDLPVHIMTEDLDGVFFETPMHRCISTYENRKLTQITLCSNRDIEDLPMTFELTLKNKDNDSTAIIETDNRLQPGDL